MPSSKKIFAVDNLVAKLKQAQALVLTDYRGLDVAQINALRRKIKETGAEYEVVKNTLMTRAAKGSQLPLAEELTGPTAALWIYETDPAPLKVLQGFINENEKPEIKTGFWQGEAVSKQRILWLASLPGLKELQAQLVAQLASPTLRLTRTLSANLQKLILVLKAQTNKGEGVN